MFVEGLVNSRTFLFLIIFIVLWLCFKAIKSYTTKLDDSISVKNKFASMKKAKLEFGLIVTFVKISHKSNTTSKITLEIKRVLWLMKFLRWSSVIPMKAKNLKLNLVISTRERNSTDTTKLGLKKERQLLMIMPGLLTLKSQIYSNRSWKCTRWAIKTKIKNLISSLTSNIFMKYHP